MSDPTALYEEKAELLKALAHPLRLRIVRGLLKWAAATWAAWRTTPASPSPASPST